MIDCSKTKNIISFFILINLAFLISCGEPRIDTKSSKSIKASIDAIREELPKEQLAQFNSSLRVITIKYSNMHKSLQSNNKLIEVIDGKSGLEIIAEAEKIQQTKR